MSADGASYTGEILKHFAARPQRLCVPVSEQLRIVLTEGRKRQLRRMCELVGLRVLGLQRVRIGKLRLGALPEGQGRFLKSWESLD